MDHSEKKTDVLREDFKQKLQIWFENKGIKNQLELYLRSQMIAEFQRNCGHLINSAENSSVSPKTQAVKLLIADFLVQEDLIFSLSVFCSEVPFLQNLNHFSSYVSHLAKPLKKVSVSSKQVELKFNNNDISDILDVLGLNLNKEEFNVVCDKYKTSKFSSLLTCLLCMLPILLKKYRNMERTLNKTKKKEKYFKKVAKTEKIKAKQMYSMLENAHDVMQKHKTEMSAIYEKENQLRKNSAIMEEKLSQLLKKETELMNWQKSLESKEFSFEKNYESNLEEIENKLKMMKVHEDELQDKYKILQEERVKLNVEKDSFAEQMKQMTLSNSQEAVKLEEYEQKFRLLQDEVKEILAQCIEAQSRKVSVKDKQVVGKDTQYNPFDTQGSSQQSKSDVFINIEEYVELLVKENSLLKLNSNKQRYCINQLTSEIMFLKNQLDYLKKEIEMKNQFQLEEMTNQITHKLYFPRKPWYAEGKSKKFKLSQETDGLTRVQSRRRLFDDVKMIPSSDLSSSDNSKRHNRTDEIVADAKNKLKELENESEALNRNLKNLQNVLCRNIALSDKLSGYSSLSDSSPSEKVKRFPRLLRSYSDSDKFNIPPDIKHYENVSLHKFDKSISDVNTNKNLMLDSSDSVDLVNPEVDLKKNFPDNKKSFVFSKIFQKYRKIKKTAEEQKCIGNSDSECADKILEPSHVPQVLINENENFPENDISTNIRPQICSEQTPVDKSICFVENNAKNKAVTSIPQNELKMTQYNKTTMVKVEHIPSMKDVSSNEIDGENNVNRESFEKSTSRNVSRELFPSKNNSPSDSKSEGIISGASADSKLSSDFWN